MKVRTTMYSLIKKILFGHLHRILTQWIGSCESSNLTLPSKVDVEFKKRITRTGNNKQAGKAKAKLNLSKCNLNDEMVLIQLSFKSHVCSIILHPSMVDLQFTVDFYSPD